MFLLFEFKFLNIDSFLKQWDLQPPFCSLWDLSFSWEKIFVEIINRTIKKVLNFTRALIYYLIVVDQIEF